jgi:hypothetical protein
MPYPAISVDLPWSLSTRDRTVIAAWSGANIALVTDGLDGEGLEQWLVEQAAPGARVLLDVPIDGCAGLCRDRPRRPVDDGLTGIGISILPSYKSGMRGPDLRAALLRARPDLQILESYPYSVLRVLWGVNRQVGNLSALTGLNADDHSTRWPSWWTNWPPRYKRAPRIADRRKAVSTVAELLKCCGAEYAARVRPPSPSATTSELARLSDEYDALLGLIAARAMLDRLPWSWAAEVSGAPGSILTIAAPWIRTAFAGRVSSTQRLS